MRADPHSTYEDAAREYRAKLRALIQLPQEVSPRPTPAPGAVELPIEILIQRAKEIAVISSGMIPLAQPYLNSADPLIREGICGHFIDQATVELLLATELIQIAEEEAGKQCGAATRATLSAALRESISAADKSLAVPVAQGLPTVESYRATESTTIEEAASALKQAVASTTSSISRRVQELGRDIAFDLVVATLWTEVNQGAMLSGEELAEGLESVSGSPVPGILLGIHERISALLNREIEIEARGKIRDWLSQIKQVEKIELFDSLVEGLFEAEGSKKAVASMIEQHAKMPESANKASDLIKALSDRFIVLTGRMRKLEEAIRLGKLLQIPQFLMMMTALQVVLLTALVYAGRYYVKSGVGAILHQTVGGSQ